MAKVLTAEDEHKARSIDFEEKNKFRFEWLEKKIKIKSATEETEVLVGATIKKIEASGKALCVLCSDIIYYGNRGFVSVSDHIKSKKHSGKEFLKQKTYSLPSMFFNSPKLLTGQPEISSTEPGTSGIESHSAKKILRNVPLCDRVTNMQSLILGVIAEHNLPFTMATVLIDLSKSLASDKKALDNLQMSRTTASYKIKYGVAKTFTEKTVDNLKMVNFSLNIDEATSNNSLRVLCILVSYFLPLLKKVVVEHLASITCLHEPIDSNLCRNMRSSYKMYKDVLDKKMKAKEEKKKALDVKVIQCTTKQKLKKDTQDKEEQARFVHNRKRKLEAMVQKYRKKKESLK